jgi:hypothetical protein
MTECPLPFHTHDKFGCIFSLLPINYEQHFLIDFLNPDPYSIIQRILFPSARQMQFMFLKHPQIPCRRSESMRCPKCSKGLWKWSGLFGCGHCCGKLGPSVLDFSVQQSTWNYALVRLQLNHRFPVLQLERLQQAGHCTPSSMLDGDNHFLVHVILHGGDAELQPVCAFNKLRKGYPSNVCSGESEFPQAAIERELALFQTQKNVSMKGQAQSPLEGRPDSS